ncbi:cytosol aminopeptidase [Variibacter gotjawalensis]|uniref:Probable cytosol aminopeptidase n=1 Tax=Variibacter gotjawalensis TaxID=1333996 RepID=A0A0S3PYJ3_9BRAD|nr:leucyl aminopeptidase [Variibacter gotjawalensis]NIK46795.1 leucyl aminopeptidase [Variibacter gotjawalensis]RZS48699.1 leucyl aminopeptidase [Variibacter gotjawalensis]BAT60958.1 cytosol aminopeptidase [Variibacter gotjawalensis]
MSDAVKLGFTKFAAAEKGVLVLLADSNLRVGPKSRAALGRAGNLLTRAAEAEGFRGKLGSVLEIVQPAGLSASRLVVIGTGKIEDLTPNDLIRIGGIAAGRRGSVRETVIFCELSDGAMSPERAAEVALGVRLRAYKFDRYKTKKGDDDREVKGRVSLGVSDVEASRRADRASAAIASGVITARNLVNEPPNVLFPEEFATRARELKKVGLTVEVLDAKALRKLGMNALLGVAQGSRKEARVVVMRWNGGKSGVAPVAFIGKGVTFDTGGISIKPAAGMEDMKGDMGGAACVTGLMQTLAMRRAKVNAVGVIGIVENMPDGNAQRPGDIVTSMSGQTIEIINTDAEGRLVLGDVLWYVKQRFKPQFMIDLATLTGAIIIALGQEFAGMFSNDNELCARLSAAGDRTGEKVWRMPLSRDFDKMIDSKFADMKNTGGRLGGSITAAQFLQRYVDATPWVHLDIAGTAMGSPQTDINKSWGSGWGVRLLDSLVAEHYEK